MIKRFDFGAHPNCILYKESKIDRKKEGKKEACKYTIVIYIDHC